MCVGAYVRGEWTNSKKHCVHIPRQRQRIMLLQANLMPTATKREKNESINSLYWYPLLVQVFLCYRIVVLVIYNYDSTNIALVLAWDIFNTLLANDVPWLCLSKIQNMCTVDWKENHSQIQIGIFLLWEALKLCVCSRTPAVQLDSEARRNL